MSTERFRAESRLHVSFAGLGSVEPAGGCPAHAAMTIREIHMRLQGRGSTAGLRLLLLAALAIAIVAAVYFLYLAPR